MLLTLQESTAIGDLTFKSNRGGRMLTYEHSESVRGFQVNRYFCTEMGAVVVEIVVFIWLLMHLLYLHPQAAVAAVVDEELLQELNSAPFYSILIDESTHMSTDHTLIIYVRYVHDGVVHTRFFNLTELRRGTADHILRTTLEVLEAKNVTTNRMCGIATDDCNVMTGVRSGVTTHSNKINPFIVSTHCIAHRLALACGQAADGYWYLKCYQEMVNSIYNYHHYSYKHCKS